MTLRGTGPGGQHRNKTESCVRMRHVGTGIEVCIDGRKQHQNRRLAHQILSEKVSAHFSEKERQQYDSLRKGQLGTGGRGDKIRTYNCIKKRAVDHRTGKKTGNVDAVLQKGRFDLLLP